MKKVITILCCVIIFGSAFATNIASCPRLRLTLHCCQAGKSPAFWIPMVGSVHDCSDLHSNPKLTSSDDCAAQSRVYLSEQPELYEKICGRPLSTKSDQNQ